MDIEEKVALVERPPTEEIVTHDDLVKIFETNNSPKHYIGLEISGFLHLGSLLSTGYKINDFANAGINCTVFLADWHTILNDKMGGNWETIRKVSRYYQDAFRIVCPKAKIVMGTELYKEQSEYWQDLIMLAKHMSLARTMRTLTIMGRSENEENIELAKLIYPLMQAVDIHTLDVDIAHSGMDQRKIHMLVRDAFPKMGWKVPAAVHHELLLGLSEPPVVTIKNLIQRLVKTVETLSEPTFTLFTKLLNNLEQAVNYGFLESDVSQIKDLLQVSKPLANTFLNLHVAPIKTLLDNLERAVSNDKISDSDMPLIIKQLHMFETTINELSKSYIIPITEKLQALETTINGFSKSIIPTAMLQLKMLNTTINHFSESLVIRIELPLKNLDKFTNNSKILSPTGKMSKSDPNSSIFMHDTTDIIKKKINKAWCEEGIAKNNPLLQITKSIIFHDPNTEMTVQRPTKYGGNVSYTDYTQLEQDYTAKKLHPGDLKRTVGEHLANIVVPIQNKINLTDDLRDTINKSY